LNTTGLNTTGLNTTGMNTTGLNTTGLNTTGMNTTDFYTPKSSPETTYNATDDGMYYIQAPDASQLSWSEAAKQRSVDMASKLGINSMKVERDAANREKVERDAELHATKQANKQKLSWSEAATQRSAAHQEDYVSKPKTGFFWGGGKDIVIGNYTILNNFNIIIEPILLNFEIISLALLSQYDPSVTTLPKVIEYANTYIDYQNIIYESIQNKYTKTNKKTLSKRSASKKKTANKRKSANKRKTSRRSARKTLRRTVINTPRKKIPNLYKTNISYIP
jgi:hypothetical protein